MEWCSQKWYELPTQSERLRLISEKDALGRTLLHDAAKSGDCESLKTALTLYPESERLQAVRMQDQSGSTVLHDAAISKSSECIKIILSLYLESESLHAVVCIKDICERTVLHCAAKSGIPESVTLILDHCPESERLRTMRMQDRSGFTALHCAGLSGNFATIETILALYPESERLPALGVTTRHGSNVLHCVADSNSIECIKAVLSLYPESQHWRLRSIWMSKLAALSESGCYNSYSVEVRQQHNTFEQFDDNSIYRSRLSLKQWLERDRSRSREGDYSRSWSENNTGSILFLLETIVSIEWMQELERQSWSGCQSQRKQIARWSGSIPRFLCHQSQWEWDYSRAWSKQWSVVVSCKVLVSWTWKVLMALNRTCKANVIDELSLILLIESEITRSRGVDTKEEAIVFCRML